MHTLRCKTPEMVKKKIWIYLLAYNLIRKIMLDAAILRGVLPWQISFSATVKTFAHYSTLWRDKTLDKRKIYVFMLEAIAKHLVGNRPGRSEPRKRKRRPKPFPLLHGKRESHGMQGIAAREELEKYQKASVKIGFEKVLCA